MEANKNLQEIIDYLNNNYSGHQSTINERLKTIDALIWDLIDKLNYSEQLFLCIELLSKYDKNHDLHQKIYLELDKLNLDFYIPDKCSYKGDVLENRSIMVMWLYLPELLNYIPERLEGDGGWFKSNEERLQVLLEIRSSMSYVKYMDKIIWKDGNTSKITPEEAFELQYYENNNWYMDYAGFKFVWMGNCWMEVD